MKQPEFNSYIPFSVYQRGKNEPTCHAFHEDFAILDAASLRVLASRGPSLQPGEIPAIPAAEKRFLYRAGAEGHEIALRARAGVVVLRCDLLPLGLFAAILPHGTPEKIAGGLSLLLAGERPAFSPAVLKNAVTYDPEEICEMLREQKAKLDALLRIRTTLNPGWHLTSIAEYTGCHLDSRSLSWEEIPVTPHAFLRWTAFLLCLLLTLRRRNAESPVLSVSYAGDAERIQVDSEVRKSKNDTLFAFADHPAFTGFNVRQERGGKVRISGALPAKGSAMVLDSPASQSIRRIVIEINTNSKKE